MTEISERHYQQWTPDKLLFAVTVWKGLGGTAVKSGAGGLDKFKQQRAGGLDPHVLVAWMAVESGGALDYPSGGHFNYLQIKGPVGFASYPTAIAAGRSAVRRIKAEPAIMKAIHRKADNSTLMTAIAAAWDDGSGVPKNIPKTLSGPEAEYRKNLQFFYDGISGVQVLEDFNLPGGGRFDVGTVGGEFKVDVKSDRFGWVGDVLKEDLWPVLLQSAGAATGLALIGYGITQLAKTPGAGKAAQKVAS